MLKNILNEGFHTFISKLCLKIRKVPSNGIFRWNSILFSRFVAKSPNLENFGSWSENFLSCCLFVCLFVYFEIFRLKMATENTTNCKRFDFLLFAVAFEFKREIFSGKSNWSGTVGDIAIRFFIWTTTTTWNSTATKGGPRFSPIYVSLQISRELRTVTDALWKFLILGHVTPLMTKQRRFCSYPVRILAK